MPRPYPKVFRDDVVAIARRRDASFAQIAKGFGISESCVQIWVKKAEIEDGARPGAKQAEVDETRELRKRVRLLENPFQTAAAVVAVTSAAAAGLLWLVGPLLSVSAAAASAEARTSTAMWLLTISLLFITVFITLAGIRWSLEHRHEPASTEQASPAPESAASLDRPAPARLRAVPNAPTTVD